MRLLGIVAAAIVAIVVQYKVNYPTYTYRYRLTVNIEVEGQIRSGSSVIEVRVSKQPIFLPGVNKLEYADRGEAVFVDLGAGRNIVALLASGPYAEAAGFTAFIVTRHFNLNLSDDSQLASLPALRGQWELANDNLPTLVTFSDAADPATLKLIRPTELTFGPSVHWRGVSVELTTDAVTYTIESKLPWVSKLTTGIYGGSVLQAPGRFILNGPYFKKS